MDAAQVMEALGGRHHVAEKLNKPIRMVHVWAKRGFPAHIWPDLVRLARAKRVPGVTLETLRRPLWQNRRRAAGRPAAERVSEIAT